MTRERRPIVTTIVLAWNRREETLACLASLAGLETPYGHDHRIVLVDNGSTDGTAAAVREAFPALAVLALPDNAGFAAGMNAGIRHALAGAANWTLLVNNDTVAEPNLLRRLLEAADGPDVGLVTPTVCYADAPDRVWPSAGWRRPLTLAAFDTTARAPTSSNTATSACPSSGLTYAPAVRLPSVPRPACASRSRALYENRRGRQLSLASPV